jgi:hypothetical protein
MRIHISRPRFEIELGLPAFQGIKEVLMTRQGRQEWKPVEFVQGMGDVPRGWKPAEDENGYTIIRECSDPYRDRF